MGFVLFWHGRHYIRSVCYVLYREKAAHLVDSSEELGVFVSSEVNQYQVINESWNMKVCNRMEF